VLPQLLELYVQSSKKLRAENYFFSRLIMQLIITQTVCYRWC